MLQAVGGPVGGTGLGPGRPAVITNESPIRFSRRSVVETSASSTPRLADRVHGATGGISSVDSRMLDLVTDERDEMMADVRHYIRAGERLEAGLASYNAMNREALDDLLHGMGVAESCKRRDSATLSRHLTSLLADFEESRRRMRASASAALRAEGLTITQIGQVFGVSHQLAGRFARPQDKNEVGSGSIQE